MLCVFVQAGGSNRYCTVFVKFNKRIKALHLIVLSKSTATISDINIAQIILFTVYSE